MSNKLDLSDLERDGAVSLTQQLVDRFVDAIETVELEPGEKLPTTRALAADAGREPPDRRARLPPARRARLRDRHGRAAARSCARSCPPPPTSGATTGSLRDARTARSPTPTRCSTTRSGSPNEPGIISLSTGFPSPRAATRSRSSRRASADAGASGRRGDRLPHRRGAARAARADRRARPRGRASRPTPDEIIVTSGARQAIDLVARALLEPGDVAVVESPTFAGSLVLAARDRRARDRRALRRRGARHRRARARARPPRGEGRRAPDRVPEPDRPRHVARAARAARPARDASATSSSSRTASTATCATRASRRAPLRELAPGHVDLRRLAVEDRRRRPADRLDRRARPGVRAARAAQARDRLPPNTLGAAHRRALPRVGRATSASSKSSPVLPRAPRRADGGARAPPARRVPRRAPARRPPRLGHAEPARSTSARSTARPCATG